MTLNTRYIYSTYCGIPTVIPPGATGWRRPQEWEVTPRGNGKVRKNMLGPHATRKGGGIMDSSCPRPPPFNQTEEQTFLPINQLPHSPASHSQSAGKGRKSQAQGQKGSGRMGERRLRVSRNPRESNLCSFPSPVKRREGKIDIDRCTGEDSGAGGNVPISWQEEKPQELEADPGRIR